MGWFAIDRFGASARRSAIRFPLTLLAATAAAVLAVLAIEAPDAEQSLLRMLMAAQLGIPLLLSAELLHERQEALRLPSYTGLVVRVAALALPVLYFVQLDEPVNNAELMGFAQWNVLAHLLVVVLPFCRRDDSPAFFNYNVTLLLRLLNAVLFTLVLYAGLSVALLAIKILLKVDLDDKLFPQLLAVLGFVFNTWYFLGGIPRQWDRLKSEQEPPKALLIFGQYILPPLVGVYLAILTIYLVKVVVTAEWPSGWIGYLVSSVAVAGIFSLLLLHPQIMSREKRWTRLYGRVFHVLLIPAVVMLLMAVAKRVSQYGWTEPRYVLTVLAGWLALIAVAGIVRQRWLLKAVPQSLCLLALMTAWGPWGSSAVAHRSQQGRLDELLTRSGRMIDGMIVSGGPAVSPEDGAQICSLLDYLFESHGLHVLDSRSEAIWLDRIAEITATESSPYALARKLSSGYAEYLGVPYVRHRPGRSTDRLMIQLEPLDEVTLVRGYDFSIDLNFGGHGERTFSHGENRYTVTLAQKRPLLTIARDDAQEVTLDLLELLADLPDSTLASGLLTRTAEHMTLRGRCDAFGLEVQVTQAILRSGTGPRRPIRLTGVLLVALTD